MQTIYDNVPMVLAYDYDKWYDYAMKEPIFTYISPSINNHMLICGMSGSGKSYAELQILARFIVACPDAEVHFADYKFEDDFEFLRNCSRYYSYDKMTEAIEIVYTKLKGRISGNDNTQHPIILVLDEYIAYILSLLSSDNKRAKEIMHHVAELLMLSRSKNFKILISCQRADANAFQFGARTNFSIILILGAPLRSTYEMLIPKEFIDTVGDRQFGTGEGTILLQGTTMRFVKIPMIRDWEKIKEICKKGLL